MNEKRLLDQFFKDARYYERGIGGKRYAIRTPQGKLLVAGDTEELFGLYAAAIAKAEGSRA